jgi:hypothetical protein
MRHAAYMYISLASSTGLVLTSDAMVRSNLSTDGIDDSGAHHPFGEYAWNTIFLPQFTHFRMTRTRPDTMRAMTVGVTSTWNATTDMPISSMKVQVGTARPRTIPVK